MVLKRNVNNELIITLEFLNNLNKLIRYLPRLLSIINMTKINVYSKLSVNYLKNNPDDYCQIHHQKNIDIKFILKKI